MEPAATVRFAQVLERLDRVKLPSGLSFHRSGRTLAATVSPATREAGKSYQSRIWRFTLDGGAKQLTHGPGNDDQPAWSPLDDRLAFTSDRAVKGKADLFLLERGEARPLGRIPGTIEALRWSADAKFLIAMAADRGLDHAATSGAVRIWWDGMEDPAVTNAAKARRRLFRVRVADGDTVEIGPRDQAVWEFDLLGADSAIALISEDPSERGWYHAKLARIDFDPRSVKVLYSSRWQLQGPAVSPDGKHVAFLEGWSSDRGLVAGEMRLLVLATGQIVTLAADGETNISSLQWRDDESLWFAGWSRLGSNHGVVRRDGSIEWIEREDAVVGPTSFLASVTPTPDNKGLAGIREAVGAPPEIVFKTAAWKSGSNVGWKPLTTINAAIMRDYPGYPEVREARWKGKDGLDLEALVLLPPDRPSGPLPTIVDIHGGPTWSAKYAFNPGYALPLAAAGYVVFLPNYRGNTGWGQPYSKLNIGDPGGAEFDDILAGIDWCVAQGFTDPMKLGITGGSYGGYMTAWAVATTDHFKAAVMVSGIANQWSCHYSCNHDFGEYIVGGPLTEERFRKLAIERSPLFRLDKPTTPTLILHGVEDRCTPLGQGQEFHSALREHGVETELVAYPREGHGNRERAHRLDAWRRSVAWFGRFLRPDRKQGR
ncbi:prolyl oligopeptidase family serine peptidase [Hypericibacter sp.]|uniref:prolyl oligopeptidase family serine peptidase n=1 Tax=Hypericibacter sp. TaxID=2705401 RepID=UPI003D6C9EC6